MSGSESLDSLNRIAIIGLAGRFPGARNLEAFWQNLCAGVEGIRFFSEEELRATGVDPVLLSNPNFVRAKATLEDVELFDAAFFGLNPREAEITDPQHRLFLESAWEALETAGYDPERYQGAIGVYAGCSINTYLLSHLLPALGQPDSAGLYQVFVGNDKDFLPTRVSYKLNLKGPSVSIQTACSTSLVAVHQACQSLLHYECDMALAGGVSVAFPRKAGYLYQEGMILSPDGHCRAFDAEAKGTVGGEGVGIVVLKRLAEAVADGDHIYAVIRGSAINNDGAQKVGYTAPSVEGQAEVISMAQAMAEVAPDTISYIEAHGTGTPLGDPIEIAALTEAFRASTDKKGFCAIGSVKTNIGHLDAAAGVAGLIKTVLALTHKQIPPSLHFQAPNPQIDFASSPFYINTHLAEWQANGTPRRAGVSSFGIGGTNAHLVLEEAPALVSSATASSRHLLALSARTAPALEMATANLVAHLRDNPALNLADVAYTLHVGRKPFEYRRTVVCTEVNDVISALQTLDPKRVLTGSAPATTPVIVFMFSGQGAQYVNMARELYEGEPAFRQEIDRCAELLQPHLGLDLRTVLYPAVEDEEGSERLQRTEWAQPALFTVEYALAKLWMRWGIHPQALIGHSIGEYVAACLSGVFSLEEALRLVAARGRLMQALPAGAMLAVSLPEADVRPLLGDHLSLAAVNAPSLCVVSGPGEAVEALEQRLGSDGVVCRRLHTSHAFHSAMMDPILGAFREQVTQRTRHAPRIPFISNVTGTWITAEEATDPDYWARHLRQPVRFAEGLGELLKEPDVVLLEIGPGQTLGSLARQHPDQGQAQAVLSSLRHPQNPAPDLAFLLTTLGQLWLAGVQVEWPRFYAEEERRRLPLPTYPFERQRHWIEPGRNGKDGHGQRAPGKQPDLANWFYAPSWQQEAPLRSPGLAAQPHTWLVFVDECGVGARLLARLAQQGQTAISVESGERFGRRADGIYTLNPQNRDGYAALLNELEAAGQLPDVIVHLWNVTPAQTAAGLKSLEQSQQRGFYSLLSLAQALAKQRVTRSLSLQVVSNNLQDVTGEEALCPEKATLLGPCRVIPLEFPTIRCRSVDILLPHQDDEALAGVVDQLLAEALAETDDAVVAYRGRYRWVQTVKPIRYPATAGPAGYREGGVYLITGGLGGIGLTLAEHLARHAQAKLVLTARSPLPDRGEWEEWLASHDEQDPISRRLRKVQALEEWGAEVLVLSADVADLAQMRDVMRQIHEHFGELNGVIHAAGIAGDGMIQLKTPEAAAEVLAPKVRGALVLEQLLAGLDLDFCVLCSSINSLLAPFGQVDYVAANAFLDSFARHANARNGLRCVAINWDTWQEVGMAVNTAVPRHLQQERAERLKHAILPQEGQEAFVRILQRPLPQVIVSTQDLPLLLEQTKEAKQSMLPEEGAPWPEAATGPAPAGTSASHARPNLATDYVAPRTDLERQIASVWQELLGIEQIGIHDSFFDLGGDSLLAVRAVARFRETMGVDLPVHDLFEALTIAGVAETLDATILAAQTLQNAARVMEGEREEIEI